MTNRVREFRQRRGMSQADLAAQAGVTRQTVSGIESGRYGPTVEVAKRLARALGCRLDDLFPMAEAAPPAAGRASRRVVAAVVGGKAVTRPLDDLGDPWAAAPAHAIWHGDPGGKGALRLLRDWGQGVFLAGCDPALGLLSRHVGRERPGLDAYWWRAGNAAALRLLRSGEVHAVVQHAEPGGLTPPGDALVVRLGRWPIGWAVRAGNPKGIRGAADLARPGVRLANREPGSGARRLLDRMLAEARVSPAAVAGYETALPGHFEAAAAVAYGGADVALVHELAAWRLGLDFLPVGVETSVLAVAEAALDHPGVEAMLSLLRSDLFRAELAAFGPYDTAGLGDVADGRGPL
jgi:putative molybdopterin biosynthesis protein